MDAPGPLLASGRDADIFEYGPGRVLRRARDGRSLRDEASTMAYLHDHGYPVPRVDELSDDGVELVMERIEGPTMVEAIGAAPWTVRRHGHALAELHVALHELVAPPGMRAAPVGAGDRVVHLDLHPLNVLVGPRGPVVIDWSNASRGDPAVDVCVAWALMASGTIPGATLRARVLGLGRAALVGAFLSRFDRDELAGALGPAIAWKLDDAHLGATELAALRRLAARRATGASAGD
ncbi:MAG TPA: phosphotransferase [Acidimicrobiales bacterium]|nr:phosphotransferase [Acidimicrobiales bacterium]